MKKILSAFLLLLSLHSFGQVTGKTVTTINLKMDNLNTTFQKFKESEWKMTQKDADGSTTEIKGFIVLNADINSITLEQKEFDVNLKIDLTTKKVTALQNGNPSTQKFLFVNANSNEVALEEADVVDIDETIKGTTVSSIVWKNELMSQDFALLGSLPLAQAKIRIKPETMMASVTRSVRWPMRRPCGRRRLSSAPKSSLGSVWTAWATAPRRSSRRIARISPLGRSPA